MRFRTIAVGIGLLILLSCLTEMRHNIATETDGKDQPAEEVINADSSVTEIDAQPIGFVEISRMAADRECGTCHHSNRSTNTKALAVYDLADRCWYCRMSEEQIDGLERRTQNSEDFTEAEKAAFLQIIGDYAERLQ